MSSQSESQRTDDAIDIASLKPVAIFDLDGTLIDTAQDVGEALNPTLQEHGLPLLDPEQSARLMGHGLHRFAEGAFARHGLEVSEQDVAAFIKRYEARPVVHTQPYPDVPETLKVLAERGWSLLVCTNKLERLASDILQRVGLLEYFDTVCGSDAAPAKKPDPRHLEATLARAGKLDRPAVMIGDFVADLAAARDYGVPSVFACWGYGDQSLGDDATRTAQHFGDLPAILEGILQKGR